MVCANVDECAQETHTCDGEAQCADQDGSFTCTCDPGWFGPGTACTECPADQWCAAGVANVCPQHTYSPPGSPTQQH
eukprot:2192982-Rhodomonas_salina.1